MNKKWILLFLLVFLLSGCLNKEVDEVFVTPVTPEVENKFLYNPGTYRAEGTGFNGTIVVEVTVSESKILSIEIISHSEANYLIDQYGNPIVDDSDSYWDETDDGVVDEENSEVVEEEIITEEVEVLGAIDTMLNMILLEQTTSVDVISQATTSCNGLKEAVSRALAEAML